jgi:hypothetical protein
MLAHLEKSDSVYVKFDARREGVILPAHLKRDAAVVLQYGLHMRIPIPDLDIGEEGIGATLSFNRTPVWTFIPWTAVFAIVSESGAMLWESDFPRDLEVDDGRSAAARGAAAKKPAEARPSSKPQKRPSLRAVDGGRREDEAPTSKPSIDPPAPAEPVQSAPAEKMASLIDELPSEPLLPPTIAATDSGPPSRPTDEIVEIPNATKKKRELPPWLRVVK